MLLLALLLALAAPAHADPRWRWPVRGEVVTPFHVTPHPFAPGQHRGIDIAARAGARVRSACEGRVRFAGSVPGRGRVVTVRCGDLVATYLELATTAVRAGAAVAAGAPIGTVSASHLQLGARRAGGRTAYLDPLRLLAAPEPPPLGAAPRRRPPGPPRWRAEPPPRAAAPRGEAAPSGVPLAAWLGLGLLAAGTQAGALWRRRRRRTRCVSLRTADEGA